MLKEKIAKIKTILACGVMAAFTGVNAAATASETCNSVKLNGSGLWHPVSLRAAEGEPLRGIFPDLAREIFKELNIETEFGSDVPWKRSFVLLDNGSIDILTGAYRTRERFEKYGASIPVMTEEVAVFVRPDLETQPQSLEDLKDLMGLAPFGANFGEEFDEYAEKHLKIERQPFEAFATNMRLLNEGKVDYLIIARQEGERLTRYLGVEDSLKPLSWPAAVNTLHFLFSRSSPCIDLVDAFNEVLSTQISTGALDKIIQAYQSPEDEVPQD
ncbi:MAG: transporter substrate-binding domain-containing protein [Roseibium sp.]|nr:transporter substrate-binding domain-containing protein [Roseibium sp.]